MVTKWQANLTQINKHSLNVEFKLYRFNLLVKEI